MKPLQQLARELNRSPSLIRKRFKEWCELSGRNYYDYKKFLLRETPDGKKFPCAMVFVPKEAEEWIRKNLNDKRFGNNYKVMRRGSNLRKKLDVVTIRTLAEKLGVSVHKVSREFKWWCYIHGKDPHDFYKPGIGYVLPAEFIEYMEQLVKKLEGA